MEKHSGREGQLKGATVRRVMSRLCFAAAAAALLAAFIPTGAGAQTPAPRPKVFSTSANAIAVDYWPDQEGGLTPISETFHMSFVTGASWSPQGLYVVAWRGGRLAAIDPRGTIHWMLARGAPVRAARWAPDGLLIAYRSGTSLRVVYGNGIRDRAFARAAGPVTSVAALHQTVSAMTDSRSDTVDKRFMSASLTPGRTAKSATGSPPCHRAQQGRRNSVSDTRRRSLPRAY